MEFLLFSPLFPAVKEENTNQPVPVAKIISVQSTTTAKMVNSIHTHTHTHGSKLDLSVSGSG